MDIAHRESCYSSKEIIDILKSERLLKIYEEHEINAVIVFGSVVTDEFEDYSDVDIAILSKNKLRLNKIMILEEKLRDILSRDIDIINLSNDELDIRMKASIYDTGLVIYNDKLDLYTYDYNNTDRIYKENEEFRYFRERDVIYDE